MRFCSDSTSFFVQYAVEDAEKILRKMLRKILRKILQKILRKTLRKIPQKILLKTPQIPPARQTIMTSSASSSSPWPVARKPMLSYSFLATALSLFTVRATRPESPKGFVRM